MFELSTHLEIQKKPIAQTRHQAIIIDNVLANFDSLLNYAEHTAYYQPPGKDGTLYPGSRDDMPEPYYLMFTQLLSLVFPHVKEKTIARCWLSKITIKPDELHPMQTMPHYDSLLIEDMASVHYLNDNSLGGTNFYRYKKLDNIALSKDDEPAILMMLKENQADHTIKGYVNDSNSVFEKVDSIEAIPNRVVLYPGNILHSPIVTKQVSFDKKSKSNRTSVNSFFKVF